MSFRMTLIERVRLGLLILLDAAPAYTSQHHVLVGGLAKDGLAVSSDSVAVELHWLAEQGLVNLDALGTETLVARLTRRGQDAAAGRARIPGVGRPPPEI